MTQGRSQSDWRFLGRLYYRTEPGNLDHTVTPARQLIDLYIQGDRGMVRVRDMVFVPDRRDYIEEVYEEIIAVLEGYYYNCCLSPTAEWLSK